MTVTDSTRLPTTVARLVRGGAGLIQRSHRSYHQWCERVEVRPPSGEGEESPLPPPPSDGDTDFRASCKRFSPSLPTSLSLDRGPFTCTFKPISQITLSSGLAWEGGDVRGGVGWGRVEVAYWISSSGTKTKRMSHLRTSDCALKDR